MTPQTVPLDILYLGRTSGTSLDKARAYRRLGHTVEHIDPRTMLHPSPWIDRIVWRLGSAPFSRRIAARLRQRLAGRSFHVCHVDGGEWTTPSVIEAIREHAPVVINYNHDDPMGDRDARHFRAYRQSVPHYDLLVVVREDNIDEARQAGARRVLRVFRSADEVTHAPRPQVSGPVDWTSDVLFVGTWMPERGPFLAELMRLGVPLSIRGSGWNKAPEWNALRAAWRGPAVYDDDYARAVQGARISLGLLSKGNRDLHTTRSAEVPLLGSLFCAERTVEHLAMYDEGVEAVFWADAAECARQCLALLADEPRRRQIALRGQQRARANGHMNEAVLQQILRAAGIETGSGAQLHPGASRRASAVAG